MLALARIVHEGFVNNPGLPDRQPFPSAAGGCVVVGGDLAVSRCAGTNDPSRTADQKGFYLAYRHPARSNFRGNSLDEST